MKVKFINFKVIWSHLSRDDKYRLWRPLSLGFINALLETYSIFLVYIFMKVVQNPNVIHNYAEWIPYPLTSTHYITIIGCIAIFAYIMKGVLSLMNNKVITYYSEGIRQRISNNLYNYYLNMEYIDFVRLNPTEVDNIIRVSIQRLSESILSIISMIIDTVAIILIVIMLLVINWQLLLMVTIFLTVISKLILSITMKKSKIIGIEYSQNNDKYSKLVYSSMFNYKMLKLTGMNEELISKFRDSTEQLGETNIRRNIINNLPKVLLETISFITLIFSVMLGVIFTNSPDDVISIATLFLFVLMRILPLMMKMFYSLQNLSFHSHTLSKIPLECQVKVELLGDVPINFTDRISLHDIGFWYSEDNKILQNISLEISKGDKVGIIGPSGVGKSTLQDIIIGLLRPQAGIVYVDGIAINDTNIKQWRNKIGYIPQDIYLYNGTVADNVVLNREFNEEKLIKALKKAHIYDFLLEKNNIDTLVGNNGIMLSGGQKQRIGIARALYGDPEILVLDEATSALDHNTERNIMHEIYDISVEQTLIIITHRPSTLKGCNKIFKISKNSIQQTL